MKNIYCLLLLILLTGYSYAQTPVAKAKPTDPPPLPFREVSGIVKDSTDNTIIGASVTLTSKKDTLHAVTNDHGIFVFHNAKLATFIISVKEMGYKPTTLKLFYSDLEKKLVLDPIILGNDQHTLHQVDIDGGSPVVIKTDTVEYKASNYKVRPNATLDELLKKMPDVEVDKNGNVTFQGQEVKKARVNGKDFAGGDVAQAVKNLPADIVDKAQFVDDYGPNAARTGIKDGDPQKILNVTTKADRSIGNILRLTGSGGSDERFDSQVFAERLNANQQLGVIGNANNTINGVGSASGGGGGSGNTNSARPTFNYRDQWGKKIQVNTAYTYSTNNSYNANSSDGQFFSSNGTTNYTDQSSGQSHSKGHNVNVEIEYTPDKNNYVRIAPNFNYNTSNSLSSSSATSTGFQNQYQTSNDADLSSGTTYGLSMSYQHIFQKPKRNFFIQFSANHSNQQSTADDNSETLYRDSTQTEKKDSLQHFIVKRGNINTTYSTNATFVEPLGKVSQLEFSGIVNYRGYDNVATTDSITKAGIAVRATSLSNIYNYSFTETRIGVNYRLNKKKFNLSLGLTAIPTILQGTKASLNSSAYRTDFNLIPIARFEYVFSQTQRFSINYNGSPSEPTFNQIQPVIDKSNPQNVVVGNPDLKPSFRHSVNMQYNNYIPNSKLTLTANANATVVANQVVTNTIQVLLPAISSFYNENHFLNEDGNYNVNGNYGITKQLDDQKYNLKFSGSVFYGHAISMSNNIQYHSTTWRVSERFGPRLNPYEWLEMNPFVSYSLARSFFTQPNAINNNTKTTAMNIDGVFTFLKTWRAGYTASKNYIQGVGANITKNPFVMDAYIENSFFAKKNGTIRIQAFDLFNQNNFINQQVSNTSITNTKTNTNSRYVFVTLILNLQKWSGTPKRNGAIMMRRGDGSFIY